MLIGAHVSTKGGFDKAFDHAELIGAAVIQTHPCPPQQWRQLSLDDPALAAYRARADASGIPHYFHAKYLLNLAADTDVLLQQSVGSLVRDMELAERLGASGVVLHPGSHKGAGFAARLPQVQTALRTVLARTDSPARLLVENSAGAGGCVGCCFSEVGAMLAGLDDPRLGVCLDTCHAFASGYDLRTADGVAATLAEFDREIGLERLVLVHANDSRTDLGSNRDRHENVGSGFMGEAAFRLLAAHPRLRAVPWLLETPGMGQGPDRDEIDRLRGFAGLDPAAPAAVPAQNPAAAVAVA